MDASDVKSNGLVAEIVLTGGSCAGKTASLEFLRATLESRGFRVLICPEAATILWTHGVADVSELALSDPGLYCQTQQTVALLQRSMRAELRRYAAHFQQPVVIINDRGELDCRAYLTPEQWLAFEQGTGMTAADILASYDAVIHMRTAAGTPFGDISNNSGRRESSSEEAERACQRTLAVWAAHPQLHVVSNHSEFLVKLGAVLGAIDDTIRRNLLTA